MYKTPFDPHGIVRRALFNDQDDESKIDNFLNTLQETLHETAIEQEKRWNFDFVNEVPLPGPWAWYRPEEDEWIPFRTTIAGKKGDGVEKPKDDEQVLPVKVENEATPKAAENAESKPGYLRKRKLEEEPKFPLDLSVKTTVRRKIDF